MVYTSTFQMAIQSWCLLYNEKKKEELGLWIRDSHFSLPTDSVTILNIISFLSCEFQVWIVTFDWKHADGLAVVRYTSP
jgi:hypothetical protein